MNIKLRAFLETIAFFATVILGALGIGYLADTFGVDLIFKILGWVSAVCIVYLTYSLRIADLKLKESLKKVDESIGKLK